jgi:chromosome partitioning protein
MIRGTIMKTVAVCMAKGGVGKTTLAAALGVRAAKDFKRVALVDLNGDQGNLTQWWMLRGEPDNPHLFIDHEDLVEDLPAIAKDGWQACIIDTPPGYLEVIETAILVADVVLVPVKVSIFDAGSLQPVIDLCRKHRKPFAIVMSDVDVRFKTANAEVAASLKEDGLLLDVRISHLQSYMVAPNTGKTAGEIDKKAAEEIDALWKALLRLADQKRGRAHG